MRGPRYAVAVPASARLLGLVAGSGPGSAGELPGTGDQHRHVERTER